MANEIIIPHCKRLGGLAETSVRLQGALIGFAALQPFLFLVP